MWPEVGLCASPSCLVKRSCQEHAISKAWTISMSLKTALSSPFICNGGKAQSCRGLLMPCLSRLPENHPALTMWCNQTFPSEVKSRYLTFLLYTIPSNSCTKPFLLLGMKKWYGSQRQVNPVHLPRDLPSSCCSQSDQLARTGKGWPSIQAGRENIQDLAQRL